MNATKIQAANNNSAALRRQLSIVQGQIATATGSAQAQLVARAARLRSALAVASAR